MTTTNLVTCIILPLSLRFLKPHVLSLFLSLYYPLSNAEMQNPLAGLTHTFHVILFAPHNQANVKSTDSSVGLHLNVQCKSMKMNGANYILEVLTSTEVR
jgi:hypothetical protein